MERKYENANMIGSRERGAFRMASESFMANLPLLVCGMVMGLILAMEIITL